MFAGDCHNCSLQWGLLLLSSFLLLSVSNCVWYIIVTITTLTLPYLYTIVHPFIFAYPVCLLLVSFSHASNYLFVINILTARKYKNLVDVSNTQPYQLCEDGVHVQATSFFLGCLRKKPSYLQHHQFHCKCCASVFFLSRIYFGEICQCCDFYLSHHSLRPPSIYFYNKLQWCKYFGVTLVQPVTCWCTCLTWGLIALGILAVSIPTCGNKL